MLIEPSKHVGIIFQPRSGSHVVRHYLSIAANCIDLGELFNPVVNTCQLTDIDFNEKLLKPRSANLKPLGKTSGLTTDDEFLKHADESADFLNKLSDENINTVFGIVTSSYKNIMDETSTIIKSTNTQLFRLERADVLGSLISLQVAMKSNRWHNPTFRDPNMGPYDIEITKNKQLRFVLPDLLESLEKYVINYKEVNRLYGELPTIYYEQFQNNVGNLRNLFTGIPKRIISIPYNKIGIDYKSLIANLNDIEDLYETFVNDNKEYFPQYFGKLPHVTIPKSQGRQPRDLSSLQLAA